MAEMMPTLSAEKLLFCFQWDFVVFVFKTGFGCYASLFNQGMHVNSTHCSYVRRGRQTMYANLNSN